MSNETLPILPTERYRELCVSRLVGFPWFLLKVVGLGDLDLTPYGFGKD